MAKALGARLPLAVALADVEAASAREGLDHSCPGDVGPAVGPAVAMEDKFQLCCRYDPRPLNRQRTNRRIPWRNILTGLPVNRRHRLL